VYLGFFEARLLISRVSRRRATPMINQNFRPAGAHWPGPVACRWHCRRGGRLNPFNDDARTIERGEERRGIGEGGSLSRGPPFLGPARERGDPLFRQGVSRVSDPVSRLSFCLPLPALVLFYLSKERSMAVAHSGNLSLGGVMDTMRAKRCVPITIDPDRRVRQNAFC